MRRRGWQPDSYNRSLRELQRRAEAMTRGDFSSLGQPVGGSQAVESLRRAMDVMGAHIEQAQIGMQDYIAALTTAQEAERERVARELHDDTVQRLVALGQGVERVQRALARDTTLADERLRALRAEINATIQSLRAIIGGLRPPALEELGLIAAVRLMLQREADEPPHITLEVEGDERRLDGQSELVAFRIVQEAWSNIQRHADAQHAMFRFHYGSTALEILIGDDGRGFYLPPAGLAQHSGFGLLGMRERAALVGGEFEIGSEPGHGTQLRVVVPYASVESYDPICGMTVGRDAISVEYNGKLYRFCSPACRDLFVAEPERYGNDQRDGEGRD